MVTVSLVNRNTELRQVKLSKCKLASCIFVTLASYNRTIKKKYTLPVLELFVFHKKLFKEQLRLEKAQKELSVVFFKTVSTQ